MVSIADVTLLTAALLNSYGILHVPIIWIRGTLNRVVLHCAYAKVALSDSLW